MLVLLEALIFHGSGSTGMTLMITDCNFLEANFDVVQLYISIWTVLPNKQSYTRELCHNNSNVIIFCEHLRRKDCQGKFSK